VVVGAIDPNAAHAGRGIQILQNTGITVATGVLGDECTRLNESFNKWIGTRLPFVIAKCGMSLDGRLTRRAGESRWLTSAAARWHAHELRTHVDAIMIGAETLRVDDPLLTVRGVRGAKQPWRVVLTRSGKLPRNAKVFTDRFADRTLVYRGQSMPAVLRDLGAKEITSVLIEGGGDVLGQALDAGVIDKLHLYIAPLFTGGSVIAFGGRGCDRTLNAKRLSCVRYEKIGSDICVSGYVADAAPAAAE
jgi:diaminohydroxyphosphoribosylaminopyrimidine deaminase/5-amino-6-(5-phosphoribosylamino)uracil reductase